MRASPTDSYFEELKLLVNRGWAYSRLSTELLKKLEVKPTRKSRLTTINGEIVVSDVGHIFVEYKGEVAPTTAVFAEKKDANMFGLHALESLELEVDPLTGQVKRNEAL